MANEAKILSVVFRRLIANIYISTVTRRSAPSTDTRTDSSRTADDRGSVNMYQSHKANAKYMTFKAKHKANSTSLIKPSSRPSASFLCLSTGQGQAQVRALTTLMNAVVSPGTFTYPLWLWLRVIYRLFGHVQRMNGSRKLKV